MDIMVTCFEARRNGVPGGGDSHMEWTGMLIVSLRGVNFEFWSRLGCPGQNVIIFSHEGLGKGCMQRNKKSFRGEPNIQTIPPDTKCPSCI